MEIQEDTKGQLYIEWDQGRGKSKGSYKRAWIQRKKGEKDWARTGRYLNVVRCNKKGRIGGIPADFPIYNQLSDKQILWSFLYSVNAITGLPDWDKLT